MMPSALTILLRLFVVVCTSAILTRCLNPKAGKSTISFPWASKHNSVGRVTYCNGTKLESGIYNNTKHWGDCLSVESTRDETYINTVWRVYACVLAKIKDDGTGTITLSEFSQIVTAFFPNETKKSINDLIDNLVSTSGKENPWLTSNIKLTEYSSVDKIRAQYYDIERMFCENGTDSLPENAINEKSWDTCSMKDERLHRGSTCCGNSTVPLGHFTNSPFYYFNFTICKSTFETGQLNRFYKNGTLMDPEILSLCSLSCYLLEKSFVTKEELQKMAMNGSTMRLIVNATYPYLPVQLQETIAGELVKTYNETLTKRKLDSFAQYFNLTNLTENETGFLHSCIAIEESRWRINLHDFACPNKIKNGNMANWAF